MIKTEKRQFSKILCLQWAVDLRLLCFDDEKSDFGLVFLVDFILRLKKFLKSFKKFYDFFYSHFTSNFFPSTKRL